MEHILPDNLASIPGSIRAWAAYHELAGLELCERYEESRQCAQCECFIRDMRASEHFPQDVPVLTTSSVQLGGPIESDLNEAQLAALPCMTPAAGIVPVAVKKVSTRCEWDYGELVKEGATLARVSAFCPYVLRVYAPLVDGIHDPRHATVGLVTELAAGPLTDIIAQASTAQKLLLLFQAAVGLSCMHSGDMVHGNVHAACMLLTEHAELRLASGGVSRTRRLVERAMLAVATMSMSQGPNGKGHAGARPKAWSAPELLTLAPAQRSAATDTYAFGVTMWEILSATELTSSSILLQDFDEVSGKPPAGWRPPLSALPPNMPTSVQALLRSCWAGEAAGRPSMAQVATQLRAAAAAAQVNESILQGVDKRWSAARLSLASLQYALTGAGIGPVLVVEEQSSVRVEPSTHVVSDNTAVVVAEDDVEEEKVSVVAPSAIVQPADAIMSTQAHAQVQPAPSPSAARESGVPAAVEAGRSGDPEPEPEQDVYRADEIYRVAATPFASKAVRPLPPAEAPVTHIAAALTLLAPGKSIGNPSMSTARADVVDDKTGQKGYVVFSSPAPAPSPAPVPAPASIRKPAPRTPQAPSKPRATITPIWDRNPPIWQTDSIDPADIPSDLDALMVNLPPAVARDLMMTVTVPFYSEDGFALRRGLEALACQRADLRQYWAQCRLQHSGRGGGKGGAGATAPSIASRQPALGRRPSSSARPFQYEGGHVPGLPEMHVFAIADGWRKPDGGYILADSMVEEVLEIFGESLDVEQLLKYLEPSATDVAGGGGDAAAPDGVLIQFVIDDPRSSKGQYLHPVSLDVLMAQKSVCRSAAPRGLVTSAMASMRTARESEKKAEEQKRKNAANLAFFWGKKREEQEMPEDAYADTGDAWQSEVKRIMAKVQGQGRGVADSDWDVRAPLLGRRMASNRPAVGAAMSASSSTMHPAQLEAVIQREEEAADEVEQPLYFTLFIKRENGKKHHSHRWFFEGFAPVTRLRSGGRCKYFFATDCGTLYAPFCLAELVHHMEANAGCAACTGHQRIMDKEDQADPASSEGETFMEGVLRNVQGYDFESGLCVFNGMHARAGFLPVIPGPCGLFRAAALSDEIISQVRRICSTEAALDGLVQGNLKIAEDRILSYLLVLTDPQASSGPKSTASPAITSWQTHWVPTTVFFFESESTLKELVLQRRRWLNGTSAGYIWLLRQPALWRGVCAGRGMACSVLLLSILQVLVFTITFFMPGIIMVTGFLATSGILLVLDVAGVSQAFQASQALEAVYLTVAVGSYLAHVFYARLGSSNFTPLIWNIRVVLNAVLMLTNAVVVVAITTLSIVKPSAVIATVGKENFEDIQVAALFGVLYTSTPFFLAYLHSPASFITMLQTFPSYFFFTPTVLADFFSYSVARTDDLSWGTKAVSGGSRGGAGATSHRREAALARLAAARRKAADSADGGQNSRASIRALREGQRRNAAARESSWRITNTLAMVQTVGSLAIALVNYLLNGILHHYLLTVGAVTASVGVIIMLASFSFFVPTAIFGRAAGGIGSRIWAALNFAGWLAAVGALAVMWIVGDHTNSLWTDASVGFASVFVGLALLALVRFGQCCACSCCGSCLDDDDNDEVSEEDAESRGGRGAEDEETGSLSARKGWIRN